MNFINSLSPTRKKGLVAAAILLVIALVIVAINDRVARISWGASRDRRGIR